MVISRYFNVGLPQKMLTPRRTNGNKIYNQLIRLFKKTLLLVLFTFLVNLSFYSQNGKIKDSVDVKKDTLKLKYDFNNTQRGGLF